MDALLSFAREFPWLAWSALWVLVILGYAALNVLGHVITRTWRLVMVALRGWPPAHLDADGDWKPEPEASEP